MFFHAHAHSRYSVKDALPRVTQMVKTAKAHGQPALALTDHGNMSGAVELYQACRKEGLLPFIGEEFYIVESRSDRKAKRHHVGLIAFTTQGYKNLVRLSSLSHQRDHFHHRPLIDYVDLAEWKELGLSEGIALTTGCFFGYPIQVLHNTGYDAAKQVVHRYRQWFEHTYVEIQHHRISEDEHDDSLIVEQMLSIAHDLSLPAAITQDAHYCDEEDKSVHEHLKRLIAYGPDGDDAVFPGDSFHLADEEFVRAHYTDEQWAQGSEGLEDLLNNHDLIIPELEKYHYNVPLTVSDPLKVLKEKCERELSRTEDESPVYTDRYRRRYEEEVEVIEATGFAGYLLLAQEVTDYCRKREILYSVRGSASGSLVCHLLGITELDPLAYRLRYERFLSPDRTKPPDIDFDVEDVRRQELLDWLSSRYATMQIGNYAQFSINEEDGKGSLFIAYQARRRKTDDVDVGNFKHLQRKRPEDAEALKELSGHETYKSYGVHAAGVVVASSQNELESLVPTMLVASSDTTITQYTMDEVEALGLVKLDVLGLRTLSLYKTAITLIGWSPEEAAENIPLDDNQTFTMIRRGNTEGIFQLEGWTASKGCRELGVRSLKDVIRILALYRPAAIDSGIKDEFIKRRRKEAPVEYYGSEVLRKNLRETYGLPIFQEQVVGILRDYGMSAEDLTKFLKAVKASNSKIGSAGKVIQDLKEEVMHIADDLDKAGRDFLWNAVQGFAQYGFNKAHASAYGVVATRVAYLKLHYPMEWATGLLAANAGKTKEKDYVRLVKEMDIRLMRPHVNVSTDTFSLDRKNKAIRRGLVSIHGIGRKAAVEVAENAPYESISDLIERTNSRIVTGGKSWEKDGSLNGVMQTLLKAGALKDLS